MKKLLCILPFIIISQVCSAAPMGKLPIMVSRANCFAVTPVGIGFHNESLSYYVNDSHDMWVRTAQRSKQGVVRMFDSGLGYQWEWRSYASFVDLQDHLRTIWTVNGHHAIRFSFVNINTTLTTATDCNLSQGWPWNYAS